MVREVPHRNTFRKYACVPTVEGLQDRQRLEGKDSMVKNVLEALEEEGVDTSTSAGKYACVHTSLIVKSYLNVSKRTTQNAIECTLTLLNYTFCVLVQEVYIPAKEGKGKPPMSGSGMGLKASSLTHITQQHHHFKLSQHKM